ncbi:MAG: transporter substrate-binding domain-containing protein [Desulfobulbaceae bacterium]|nr:transporter substrate-binding domain-containing protein [Desulfobulbaceae bacterium]
MDVLTCAARTIERSEYLLYTKPHLSFPLIIISKKDGPFISGLQSLHKKRIALTRKNSTVDWLYRDQIDFDPLYVTSPLEALREVSLGHADATIENLATATYLIEKYELTNLKIAAPTSYKNYTLSVAVRKDWPELASILEKGLAAISQEKHN